MKKTIVALSMALMATIGIQSMAQNPENNPQNREKKEMRMRGENRQKVQRQDMAFDGITLSAEQKAKIEALKENCKNDFTIKKLGREQRDEMRKAIIQKKRDYLASMKQILTPEQYVQFLENQVVNGQKMNKGPRMNHAQKMAKDRKMNRGHRMGIKGGNGEKPGKARGQFQPEAEKK